MEVWFTSYVNEQLALFSTAMPTEFVVRDGRRITSDNVAEWRQTADIIGKGISRVVFDLGDHVLKIGSEHCNRAEVNRWEEASKTNDACYFAPIRAVAPDYSWLVMEKAEPLAEQYPDSDNNSWDNGWGWEYDDEAMCSDDAQELFDQLRNAIGRYGVGDMHAGNVGFLNGRPVIFDYAA